MADWGALYRDHVTAVSALVAGLDDVQLDAVVPATPAWRIRDVVAHLAGGPADQVTGRTDGAPGPEWTARHVAERRLLPVRELLAELAAHVDATVAALDVAERPGSLWDIAVHHADLHEALGLPAPPERFWQPIVDDLGPARTPQLVGVVPPYELFRAIFSRRSRDQLAAWGTGLDAGALDAVGVFGPRDDDQPVPPNGQGSSTNGPQLV